MSVPHRFFFIATCISTIFRQKTPFPPTCAIFAPLPVTLIVDWRWSVDYPTDVGFLHHVPHRFFFISMSFSTIFPWKTQFPPNCAIFAPLAMTSGNWRWSSDYLKDIRVPHRPRISFLCLFCWFFAQKSHFRLFSPFWRRFDAILAPLPVTSGTWRWSVEILIYVCASYIAIFLRFHVFFYHFSLKNAISAYWRHFGATSGDVNR